MRKPPALRGSDQSRVPARSGNPPEIETGSARNSRNLCQAPLRILRIERCRIPQVRKQLVRARAGNKNDLGAVRRVDRIGIECRPARELFRRVAPVRGNAENLPAIAGPRDIRQITSIGRPRRHELSDSGVCEPLRGSIWKVFDPKFVEGAEGQALAVGRQDGPSNQAGAHDRAVIDAALKGKARTDLGLHLGRERYDRGLAGLEIDTVDLSPNGHEQRFPVGHEGIAGHRIARSARFLVVACHGINEPSFFAGLEVSDAQPRLCLMACRKDQAFAIGRKDGAHGAPLGVCNGRRLAGLAIKADHLPDGKGRVVPEGAAARRVIDIAAVR